MQRAGPCLLVVNSGNHQGSSETETQGPGINLDWFLCPQEAGRDLSGGLALQGEWFRLLVGTDCQPLSWVLQGCSVWEGQVLVSP